MEAATEGTYGRDDVEGLSAAFRGWTPPPHRQGGYVGVEHTCLWRRFALIVGGFLFPFFRMTIDGCRNEQAAVINLLLTYY